MGKIHLYSFSVLLVLQAACSTKGGDEQDAAGDDGGGPDMSPDSDVAQEDEDEEELAPDMGDDPDSSEDDPPAIDIIPEDALPEQEDFGGDDMAVAAPDFRVTGPHEVDSVDSAHETADGCTMTYTHVTPRGVSPDVLLVLAHGMERRREQMLEWARHYASWGIPVAAVDLCHCTLLDTDHEQNGFDMVDLARFLTDGPVIYEGHSSGGTAAFVAAANDTGVLAMFGLDATEMYGVVAGVIDELTVPAYGLAAEPGVCNFNNNTIELFQAAALGRVLRITEADHCDFERPTGPLCTVTCGAGANVLFTLGEIQAAMLGMSTAFLVWQAGIDPSGELWWSPGLRWYDELLAWGIIAEV
ncbi:MAG: hypothetical protein ABIJ56_15530 [Pseudomonadota bacterium]